jgi:pimeloyl-ACP methyl ester carboxylesterase
MKDTIQTAHPFGDVIAIGQGAFHDALVFLHPGLGTAQMWGSFPRLLCSRLRRTGLVYTRNEYDERPEGYFLPHDFIDREAGRLEVFLQTYHVRHALLIGSSDGASIALAHAARFPARVSAIISMAAHVMIDARVIEALNRITAETLSGSVPDWLTRLHGPRARQVAEAWCGTWRYLVQTNWSMKHVLRDVRCPVFALQGSEDENGLPIQLEAIQERVPDCTSCLLPGLGHFPFKQDPDMLMDLIARFVAEKLTMPGAQHPGCAERGRNDDCR